MSLKIVFAAIAAFAVMLPCHARWGFSIEQCKKQYGEPKELKVDEETKVLESATFHMKEIRIKAFFKNQRVYKITYCRVDDADLDSDTLFTILNAYSDQKRDLAFQPLETVDYIATVTETMKKEDLLRESTKRQLWVRFGENSGGVPLFAAYYRNAKMLVIADQSWFFADTKAKKPKADVGF